MPNSPEYWKQYYIKNKAKIYAKNKLWEKSEKGKEYGKKYRKSEKFQQYLIKTKVKRRLASRNWRKLHRTVINNRNRQERLKILTLYGGNPPKCNCCGENIIEFLGIDHVNGGGRQHRKQLKISSIYTWLRKNNYPEGFQVLCHNCNMAKGFYGKCPHENFDT